jgi:hypothetical protein
MYQNRAQGKRLCRELIAQTTSLVNSSNVLVLEDWSAVWQWWNGRTFKKQGLVEDNSVMRVQPHEQINAVLQE